MKKITIEQYGFLNTEREKLDTLIKSKYLRDLNHAWYAEAKKIYTKITGRLPGACTGCTVTVLAALHKAIINYEKELQSDSEVVTLAKYQWMNIGELLESMSSGECDDCGQSIIKEEELKSEEDVQKEEGFNASEEGTRNNDNDREFNKTANRRTNNRQRSR